MIMLRLRHPGSTGVSTGLLCVVCMALLGCSDDLPGKPKPADRPRPQNEITDFATLFAQNCTGCHGQDGTQGPAPPLNDALFLALIPDDALLSVIRDGRPGTPMPAFAVEQGGTLTAEQIEIISKGVKTELPTAESDEGETTVADASSTPPYLLPSNSLQLQATVSEQASALFERACAECHGLNGAGGETGYASGGAINDRAFLALISDQALRRIIITGRHDLGMPNFAQTDGRPDDFKPLTSEEIDELVALLSAWRRGDAGTKNTGAGGPDTRPQKTINSQQSTGRVSGSRQRQEAVSTPRPNRLPLPLATPTPWREELERLVNHSRQGVGATH